MSQVDLSALRMKEAEPVRRPRGPLVIGVAAVVVVLVVAGTFLWPLLRPVRTVATAAVRSAFGDGGGARSAVVEAAGWIEPDPFPVVVRPLVSGRLRELLVLEGDVVQADTTPIGRLESAALLAARDRAQAELDWRQAGVGRAEAVLAVARGLLEQKADLRQAVVDARHELSSVQLRLAAARGAQSAATANLEAKRAQLLGHEKLLAAGGSYPVALAKAQADVRVGEAAVETRARELEALQVELEQDQATLALAEEVLADPRKLAGAERTAAAELARAQAERDAAAVEQAIAERELGWADIVAPADGVVLKVLAAPGDEVGPDGQALVALYDPAHLQARIDVPLASVGVVAPGQEVEIRAEVLGTAVTRGTVLRIQRESDLLKNMLQVKVRLHDPDPLLRPETLCRARFLGTGKPGESAGPARFLVPRTALRGDAVFVLDPSSGRARRVAVQTEGEVGDRVLVRGELSPTQRVVLDEVADGERVRDLEAR